MRRFKWVAAAVAAAAIALSALGNQPAGTAASAGEAPVVLAASGCPRLIPPKCPRFYKAACTQWGRGALAWRPGPKCCTRMGCVPNPA
jgi:hypothetical protein